MEEKTNKTFEITKDNLDYFRFLSDEEGALNLIKHLSIDIIKHVKIFMPFLLISNLNSYKKRL